MRSNLLGNEGLKKTLLAAIPNEQQA